MPYIHRHFNSISKSYYSHTRGTNASSLPAEYVILKKWKKNPTIMRAFRKASTQMSTKIYFSPSKNTCLKLIPKWFDTWKLMVLKCKIKLPLSIVSVTAKKSILKYAVTHILENTITHTWNQIESLPHWFVDPNHVCHLRGFPWFCSMFLQVLD